MLPDAWSTRRALPSRRALWLVPVVAAAAATLPEHDLEYLLAGLLGLVVLAWATARPGRALLVLMVFLPLETVGFGFLLGTGVPAGILRAASGLKELMVAALVLSAADAILRRRRRLAALDGWALAYLAVVTLSLIAPRLFSDLDVSLHVRLLAWRVDCGYVLLFLGVRHAPVDDRSRRRCWAVIGAIGALTVLTGLIQKAAPARWSSLLLHQGHAAAYLTTVIHDTTAVASQTIAYLKVLDPLRVSAIFESPFDMGDYLVIAAAYVLVRISRDRRGPWLWLLLGGVVGVLFFSRVRADSIALGVVVLLALLPSPRKPVGARLRLLGALLLGLVLLAPVIGGTRFVGAQGGTASNRGHQEELAYGVAVLEHHPLGAGLGANPETATRFLLPANEQGALTTDNVELQVGDELGFEALVPWVLFVVALLLALRRRARGPDGDPLAAAAGLALVGILVAGQYHEAFLNYDVCWSLWAAVGAALPSCGAGAPGRAAAPRVPLATMSAVPATS